MLEIIIAVAALVIAVLLSLFAAYRVVIHNKTICVQDRDQNGDVHLDDICKKYLRLTNID